jgi:hypothetical protein
VALELLKLLDDPDGAAALKPYLSILPSPSDQGYASTIDFATVEELELLAWKPTKVRWSGCWEEERPLGFACLSC